MKRFLSMLLVAGMLFATVVPSAFADGLIDDTGSGDTPVIEIDDLEVYTRQVNAIRDEVNSLPSYRPEDDELKAEFNKKADELNLNIQKAGEGAVGGFADIYDLSSIPQRLILFGRLCRAMRFATTELRYKVDAAHAEIAEWIFAGLVVCVSPFHSVEDMKAYMEEFEVLRQKLLSYPDMGLNDTANIYVRADLDVKLNKARMMKYNELKEMCSDVIDALDSEIKAVTKIRLRPQETVASIYKASDRLDAAVAAALSSENYRAGKYEIQDLKEVIRRGKQARMKGDKREELNEALQRANKELQKSRPSAMTCKQLKQMLEDLLNY